LSRKTQRNQHDTEQKALQAEQAVAARSSQRRNLAIAVVAAMLLALAIGTWLGNRGGGDGEAGRQAALASEHSPSFGEANAPVHVVEFLDPACETCAAFFPIVKQVALENPGKIRLSTRHVAFHEGSEFAVRVLEASRKQDKYWETLQTLLGSQARWAPHHRAIPELILESIAGLGLDLDRLRSDMNAPEVTERIARDLQDAQALKVTATPEYFVNGRGLPEFGEQPLRTLLSEELQKAR
jgi:protein-disulfide isomerase